LDSVSGIAYIDANKKAICTPKRAVLTELDILPQPAWDLIDVGSYKKVWKNSGKTPYLNIATTRGCPYKCNWCAKPIYGNRYNTRSPKLVVDELVYHIE